jgi:hypothetical protein
MFFDEFFEFDKENIDYGFDFTNKEMQTEFAVDADRNLVEKQQEMDGEKGYYKLYIKLNIIMY